MLWVILFVVVIGVAFYLVDKKIKVKYEDKFDPKDWDLPRSVELPDELAAKVSASQTITPQLVTPAYAPTEKLRYQKKSSVLSPEYTQFYRALRTALANEFSVLTNINAADVLAVVETSSPLIAQVAVKNIAAQEFNFLVCDKTQLSAKCAVMLGDNLETLLINACESAQLPLVRIQVQASYDPAIIRAKIFQAIGVADVSVISKLDIVGAKANSNSELANEQTVTKIESKETPANNGIELKMCPNCSSVMLKRKAKNGTDAGKLFWICPTYPKCRGMVLVK
jgi:hypothetical protein